MTLIFLGVLFVSIGIFIFYKKDSILEKQMEIYSNKYSNRDPEELRNFFLIRIKLISIFTIIVGVIFIMTELKLL
jgi:hypothetical protein